MAAIADRRPPEGLLARRVGPPEYRFGTPPTRRARSPSGGLSLREALGANQMGGS